MHKMRIVAAERSAARYADERSAALTTKAVDRGAGADSAAARTLIANVSCQTRSQVSMSSSTVIGVTTAALLTTTSMRHRPMRTQPPRGEKRRAVRESLR